MTTRIKTTWQKNGIKERLDCALHLLFKNDSQLFKGGANERSLTHMLALYLAESFPEHHVDCEYNRMWVGSEELKKKLILAGGVSESVPIDDSEAITVFPDIIVHRRENSNNNLLVIEAKKSSNQNRNLDFRKLNSFMRGLNDGGRGYQFSALVVFNVTVPKESTYEVKDRNETWNV